MNTLCLDELPLYWEMVNAEKIALLSLLQERRPAVSIEIGTKKGGSLQLISRFSKKIYSLDIDPAVKELEVKFDNVCVIVGDSKQTLPRLLGELAERAEQPGFILIDGDHSREGVRRDVESVLNMPITEPLLVLMHDSFNPECRQGMLDVDYAKNPFVETVDLDFVQGIYSPTEKTRGEMWGGFGLISLKPKPQRKLPLVRQCNLYSYERTYQVSTHFHYKVSSVQQRLKSFLFRKLFI